MADDITALDLASRFGRLKEQVPGILRDILTVEGRTRRLVPDRVWVEDMSDEQAVDKSRLKDVKLAGGSWKIPVYADLSFVDKATGKTVATSKRVRVADLPRPTPHQSVLLRGTEYHPHSQFRLKPGVYVRERQTGEVAAQFNFAKTREVRIGFELALDPDAGVFLISIAQANIGLYPILQLLGVSDAAIEQAWGSKLFAVNKKRYATSGPAEVSKFYRILKREAPPDAAAARAVVQAYFSAAQLNGDVTEMTLGKRFDTATPESLLAASRKMVLVNKGQVEADDRDELRFKRLMTYDEHVVERLQRAKAGIQGKLKYRVDNKETPKDAILRQRINQPIDQHFTGMTGLSSSAEQLNPVALLAENLRVVSTGEGGIRDLNVVTEAARNVHPSQAGFVDPIPTSQSKAAGISLNLALGAKKRGEDPVTEVYDLRTKSVTHLTPTEIYRSVVALPDQYAWKGQKFMAKGPRATVLKAGKTTSVPANEVTHVFTSPKALFSLGTNLVPFVDSAQGNRVLMASNQFEQVVPLVDPDAPLVQSRLVGAASAESVVGQAFSVRSPVAGKVVVVEKGKICIKPSSSPRVCVSLYDNYPLNTGFIDSKPRVKVGDEVKAGQLLADTNTTKDGVLAMGANLRTAYLSMKGLGFEDSIVVSEHAAQRLTSEHIHRFTAHVDDRSVLNRRKFDAAFPSAMSGSQRAKVDADGVIKKGSRVTKDDVLIAHLRIEEATPEDIQMGRLYRKLAKPWRDRSERWHSGVDGTVVDVVKQPGSVTVYVKTQEPLKVGDKLAGRHGNKGVVGAILSSGEMPSGEGGPIDVIMNPLGVPSRLNPSQIHETATGKAAARNGVPIIVDNFEHDDEDNVSLTKRRLKEAGFNGSDLETVTDPKTGRPLRHKVAIGVQQILKLEHQADHKFSARSTGAYDKNMQPTKSGSSGSSSLAHLEQNALLAHGAHGFLNEVITYKSDGAQNDEFWRAVRTGRPLPPPQVPFVFDKFLTFLKGGGINVERKGNTLQVAPMTDKDVLALSSGEIRKPEFLRAKNLKEIRHGLFDEEITGGVAGRKWAHVDLAEPVANPVTKRAAASVLGMTRKDLNAIAEGGKSVDVDGVSMTGGAALKELLRRVNVEDQIRETSLKAKNASASRLDEFNRKLRYLKALKESGTRPEDSYTLSKVPIIPPVMRPVYPLPTGELRPAGVNLLLADVMHVNNGLRELNQVSGIPESVKADSRRELQRSVDATFGFGDPLPTTKNRAGNTTNLRGLVADVVGQKPKEGLFQDKVWRKQQDLSGRAVITPEPDLGMDEIRIPEDMAWEIYKPFVIRELVRSGSTATDAAKEVESKTPRAKSALERAMQDRPVAYTRAPSLHKWSVMGAKAGLSKGKSIQLPPLVVAGFNADFDGDTMSVHVPVTDEGVKDVLRMMPSNHLIQPSTGRAIMVPSMEGVLGIALITKAGSCVGGSYDSLQKARADYMSGKADPTCRVTIAGKQTTIGRELVKDVLGKWYDGGELSSKRIETIAKTIAEEEPKKYPEIFRKLVTLAHVESFQSGFTVGIDDIDINRKFRDDFFAQGDARVGRKLHSDARTVAAYGGRTSELDVGLIGELESKNPGNAFLQMMRSGAKGGASQLRQILASPVMVEGPDGMAVPIPIRKSYAEGLPLSDMWTTTYGVRKGVIDRSLAVEIPGVFAKRAIAATMSIVVTTQDCGTLQGVKEPIDDPDISGRYLAVPVGSVKRNTLLTPRVIAQLRKARVRDVVVRSQLKCEATSGVCRMCYGVAETGSPPSIGSNIGVENAQYMTEPATQAQMRTFHTGGAMGSGFSLNEGFPSIDALTRMPKLIRGQATLARESGRVSAVKAAPAGGWHVFVGTVSHYVPQQNRVSKKVGDIVEAGEALSTGLVHPRELSELTDVSTAQTRMVSDLREQYGKMGRPINKRVIETLVRGLTGTVQVLDPGDHDSWLPGDHIPLSHVTKHNAGTNSVVKFKPAFKGMVQAPLVQEDWIARLGATYLKAGLEDAASKHLFSDLAGTHPLPRLVSGMKFTVGD